MATAPSFAQTLTARCKAVNSLLCVGLDPHSSVLSLYCIFKTNTLTWNLQHRSDLAQSIPPNATLELRALAAEQFCNSLIQETHPYAAAFKPNAAFFEALGWRGIAALERVVANIPKDIPVILDAKRGDISTTAEAYAEAAFTCTKATAITLNAYMGWDAIEPFVKDTSKGAFILCKTSNKTSDDLQTLAAGNGTDTMLFSVVAKKCAEWNVGRDNIGLVVGATDIKSLSTVRRVARDLWILAPGVGAQGGDLTQAVQAGLRSSDGLGLLIAISRGISRSKTPAMEAKGFRDAINAERIRLGFSKHSDDSTSAAAPSAKRQHVVVDGDTGPTKTPLATYQTEFFQLALSCGVLKFGSFKLKSGRISPYFFDAGLFNTGRAAACVARCYAQAIVKSDIEFDVIFGPAYKGITLAATIAAQLFSLYARDVPYAYNRKEQKDHGEGGNVVGATINSTTRVLIVDDVITAGTAVRESVTLLRNLNAKVVGLIVAIDRQEVGNDVSSGSRKSAVDSVSEEFGFPIVSIVTLNDLLAYCANRPSEVGGDMVLKSVTEYRAQYGV